MEFFVISLSFFGANKSVKMKILSSHFLKYEESNLTCNTLHLRDSRFFDIIECHVPTIQANWMFPDGKVVYRLSTWVTFWIYFWLHYATTYMVHICDMWASVSRFSINYSWTATIHECIFLFRFFCMYMIISIIQFFDISFIARQYADCSI